MKLSRRAVLGGSGVALAGSTAGCLDVIFGEELEFEATTATVPESTLGETGYEENAVESTVIERTFEAGGSSQDVVVTNWQAAYDKAVELGIGSEAVEGEARAATFTALSTPQVSILGRTFNPIADMSPGELAEMVQDRYEGVGEIERVGEDTATIRGESTTVAAFESEAELGESGVTVDIVLHVSEAVQSDDDLIVAVGGYPKQLADQERGNVFTMMEAIEHGS